jgi:hypothetical protein
MYIDKHPRSRRATQSTTIKPCSEPLFYAVLLLLSWPCTANLGSAWVIWSRLYNHRRLRRTATKSRAKILPRPSHPRPKCFTHVSVGATQLLSVTVDSGFVASQKFDWDISHWANSSSQVPVCTVEPGTPTDVGIIVSRSFHHRGALSLFF